LGKNKFVIQRKLASLKNNSFRLQLHSYSKSATPKHVFGIPLSPLLRQWCSWRTGSAAHGNEVYQQSCRGVYITDSDIEFLSDNLILSVGYWGTFDFLNFLEIICGDFVCWSARSDGNALLNVKFVKSSGSGTAGCLFSVHTLML